MNIEKIFPIVKVKDNLILSGAGDLTFGYELELPEIFTMTREDYISIYSGLLSFFKNLPNGIVVTQQDYYFTQRYESGNDFNSFTLKEDSKALAGRRLLKHKSLLYISVPDKKLNPLSASENSAIKTPNFLTNVYDEFPKTIELARSIKRKSDIALSSIDLLKVKELNTEELKNNIYQHWSNGDAYKPGKQIPPLVEEDGFIKIDGQYIGVISLTNHGEMVQIVKKHKGQVESDDPGLKIETEIELELSQMHQVGFGLPFNHMVQRSITIKSKESMKVKLWLASTMESTFASLGWEESQKRIIDINGFKDAATNRGYTYCDTSLTLFIPEMFKSDLKSKIEEAKNSLYNINEGTFWVEPYADALPLWVSATPGYARGNYRTFYTVVEHATTYFTLDTNLRGSNEGHIFVDRLGNPLTINLWKNQHIANKNGLVEGGSGTGKSVWMNKLIDQDLEMGYHVIILDVGHSYKDQCTIKNGIYKDSRDQKSLASNIFLCDKDNADNWIPDDDKLLFVHTVILTIWKSVSSVENSTHAILFEIVEGFYHHINETNQFPTFKLFYEFARDMPVSQERSKLFNKEDFVTSLKPFATGRYKELLNSTSTQDLRDEKFIVFDIEAVSEDQFLFPIMGLIIMEMAMEKIRKLRGIRKRFIIDEGWKILKGEMSGFVEYLYRTIRKNEGAIWLATQAISDLPQNVGEEMSKALVSNADTLVLMRRGTNKNYPDLKTHLSLTDAEVDLMKDLKRRDNLNYREFLLKQGDKSLILRSEISDKALIVFSSEGDEKKELTSLYNETQNIKQAVNQFLENREKAAAKQ
jgi:conjugation system TraG family ATPase